MRLCNAVLKPTVLYGSGFVCHDTSKTTKIAFHPKKNAPKDGGQRPYYFRMNRYFKFFCTANEDFPKKLLNPGSTA
eukprot:11564457-Karenia_brevis.AAC.1